MNLDLNLTSYIKIKTLWINLNMKCKIIELLEENIRGNLQDLGLGKEVFNVTTKALSIKKISKLEFIKFQKLLLYGRFY